MKKSAGTVAAGSRNASNGGGKIFGLPDVRGQEVVMKSRNALVLMAALLAVGALVSESAFADRGGHFRGGHFRGGHFHGGHVHKSRVIVGIGVGLPVYWGAWGYYPPPVYYYPPYYYPRAVAVPYSPPAYIERADEAAPGDQPSQWWYYCADSKAYYPYVKECPGGWQRVAPQPPPPR